MKNKIKISHCVLVMFLYSSFLNASVMISDYPSEIIGVWNLTSFEIDDGKGNIQNWCDDAFGSIVYYQSRMSVAINCKSIPKKMIFYSGPYNIDGESVVHHVQNYSDSSLKQVFRRKIKMSDSEHLKLVGNFGKEGTVSLSWTRRERIVETSAVLPGVYMLTRSSNDFQGKTDVPYCNGVFGSILYTPGGYVSVSLNCLPKKDARFEEPADIHGRKYFYSGTYELGDGVVTHMPENGSIVEHIGEPQIRIMTLNGSELTLTGTNGSSFVAIWKK